MINVLMILQTESEVEEEGRDREDEGREIDQGAGEPEWRHHRPSQGVLPGDPEGFRDIYFDFI